MMMTVNDGSISVFLFQKPRPFPPAPASAARPRRQSSLRVEPFSQRQRSSAGADADDSAASAAAASRAHAARRRAVAAGTDLDPSGGTTTTTTYFGSTHLHSNRAGARSRRTGFQHRRRTRQPAGRPAHLRQDGVWARSGRPVETEAGRSDPRCWLYAPRGQDSPGGRRSAQKRQGNCHSDDRLLSWFHRKSSKLTHPTWVFVLLLPLNFFLLFDFTVKSYHIPTHQFRTAVDHGRVWRHLPPPEFLLVSIIQRSIRPIAAAANLFFQLNP